MAEGEELGECCVRYLVEHGRIEQAEALFAAQNDGVVDDIDAGLHLAVLMDWLDGEPKELLKGTGDGSPS